MINKSIPPSLAPSKTCFLRRGRYGVGQTIGYEAKLGTARR